jgi:hypothetical protein
MLTIDQQGQTKKNRIASAETGLGAVCKTIFTLLTTILASSSVMQPAASGDRAYCFGMDCAPKGESPNFPRAQLRVHSDSWLVHCCFLSLRMEKNIYKLLV